MSRVLTVVPTESVNGIAFGSEREIVRKEFGEYTEFKKSPFSKNTTDDFGDFHVYYDADNHFVAIEIFGAEVRIDGLKFFPASLNELSAKISDLASEEKGCWESKSRSIGIYAPRRKVEAVLFGKTGYYG